jgi:hypothetical protein
MTTFNENPYAKARNMVNGLIFKNNLNKTLDSKFKHKKFSERFAPANTAFLSMGMVAQISSMITAFVMLSYLFVSTPVLIRVLASVTLLIAIEVIKRLSTNDVMQGIFQYKSVEPFAAILGIATLTASIYIAIEGAKILPSLLVFDAVQEQAKQKAPDAINEDFDGRIAALTTERDEYRKNRLWKGRLRSEDAAVIEQYNEDIKGVQAQKDAALASLVIENKAARTKAFKIFEERSEQVKVERADLGRQLVIAAIGFEFLFVLSMCFSWWYYTECEKERQQLKGKAEMPIDTGNTSKVTADTSAVKGADLVLEVAGARSNKIGFRDYETVPPTPTIEVEKVKKDYTRICPECGTPFVHKNHNHTYCTRACYLSARKKTTIDKI